MIKRLGIAGGCLLLVLGMWLLYDHFHYSPPDMSEKEIRETAARELRSQADKLMNSNRAWKGEGVKPEFKSLEILKVGKIREKTYLVFKMNYRINMSQAMTAQMGGQFDNVDYYVLGLRLLNKHLTGLKLEEGMEFDSSYLSMGPADCGRHPDGIFYAYFKDPQVKTMLLESNEGRNYTAAVKNRVVLMPVPPGRDELYPRFYDAEGREIAPSNNLRLAFISGDTKAYQPYSNIPAEWWPLKASDIVSFGPDSMDAVWVFPDQLNDMRQKQNVKKLHELLKGGIPVLFVGWKDPGDIARLLGTSCTDNSGKADSIEAVYASTDNEGVVKVGTIGLEDEGSSPLLSKTLILRYKLEDTAVKKTKGNKASPKGEIDGKIGSIARPVPVPTVSTQKSVRFQGVNP